MQLTYINLVPFSKYLTDQTCDAFCQDKGAGAYLPGTAGMQAAAQKAAGCRLSLGQDRRYPAEAHPGRGSKQDCC